MEREFVRAMSARVDAEHAVGELEAESRRASLVEYPNVERLDQRELYLAFLADRAEEARQVVMIRRDEEDGAKEKWLQARRDRQAMDKLKERALTVYLTEEQRREQRDLDEWAVLRRRHGYAGG